MRTVDQQNQRPGVLSWSGPGRPTYVLILLFVLVGMAEGFDVQAMALAAPLLSVAWGIGTQQMGLLLAVSVIGMVCGSFALSPLGDRFGRRPCILLALTVSAFATGLGAYALDVPSLASVRFLAGVGLGMALPNVVALASELVPPRMRILTVVLVCAGYPLGAAVGSGVTGHLIPSMGYAAVFVVGGVATLLVTLLCALFIPESPNFLLSRPGRATELARLLRRIGASRQDCDAGERAERRNFGENFAALFTPPRRRATILLWIINFANTALVYFYFNWLPSLLVHRGASAADAVKATALFSGSGVLGGLLMAYLLPRAGPRNVLAVGYAIAIATALMLASISGMGPAFLVTLAITGAAVIGSQFGLTAVVNQYYPPIIRTTASGYASGMGRLGAVVAPIAGGWALGVFAGPGKALVLAAVPSSLALLGMLILGRGADAGLDGD